MLDIVDHLAVFPPLVAMRKAALEQNRRDWDEIADAYELACKHFFVDSPAISVFEFAPRANAMAAAWEEISGQPQGGPFLITEYQRLRKAVLEARDARKTEIDKACGHNFGPLLDMMRAWAAQHEHGEMMAHVDRLQEALDSFFKEDSTITPVEISGIYHDCLRQWEACTGEAPVYLESTADSFYKLRWRELARRRHMERPAGAEATLDYEVGRMLAWAEVHGNTALADLANAVSEAFEAFFQEPALMDAETFADVVTACVRLWERCSREPQGEPPTAAYWAKLREDALDL